MFFDSITEKVLHGLKMSKDDICDSASVKILQYFVVSVLVKLFYCSLKATHMTMSFLILSYLVLWGDSVLEYKELVSLHRLKRLTRLFCNISRRMLVAAYTVYSNYSRTLWKWKVEITADCQEWYIECTGKHILDLSLRVVICTTIFSMMSVLDTPAVFDK